MPDIVTLTMNPALDISTGTARVLPTNKLRCGMPRYDPGGGGINVARVAHVLGASVIAVFPAGGATGGLVECLLEAEEIPSRRVHIAGSTRESFSVDDRTSREQFRFVLPGPDLTAGEQEECLDVLAESASDAAFVVASGSLPPNVAPDFYQRVADVAGAVGARFVLDTSGAPLQHTRSGVYLIKPSLRELRESVGRELDTEHAQIGAASELIDAGRSEVVILSLGSRGALAVTADSIEWFPAIDVPVRSAVGAGDSMVAAITLGLSRGWSLGDAARFGIAAAAASLTLPGTETCRREDVERLYAAQPVT